MNLKLGKLAPRHDPRSLKLARYLNLAALPPLKDQVVNSAVVKVPWGMMRNDEIGDCTAAAFGHLVMMMSATLAAAGKYARSPIVPSDEDVEMMYESIGGYKPGDASTDNGAVELDALKYMRSVGMCGLRLDAFADVTPSHLGLVKYCVQLFGSCYIGVSVPQSAMDDFDAGKGWSNASDTNVIGGHAIPIVDYDDVGPTCVTWGRLQPMTWEWFLKYCDEAHAPLWFGGFPPSTLDIPALEADLKLVTA